MDSRSNRPDAGYRIVAVIDLHATVRAYIEDLRATGLSVPSIIAKLATGHGTLQAVALARLSMACYQARWTRPLAHALQRVNVVLNSVDIHPSARIAGGLVLVHGMGTVIGGGTEIGPRCTLYHNVTVGARSKKIDGRQMPRLEEGVTVFAGACVLGPITIGARSVVASNAVVVHDIPEDSTAATVTARAVKHQHP